MKDAAIKPTDAIFSISAETLPKYHRRRSIIREFSLNTTAHGIPGIARSRTLQNRLFWTISSTVFTCIMLYFIVQSLKTYFDHPTQTSVSIDTEWPQPFAAVTICNYSPLCSYRFVQSFTNYTRTLNLSIQDNPNELTYKQLAYVDQFIQYKINRGESLDEYFFPLSSMLIKCRYNGKDCSADDFTSVLLPQYGLCYTFNAKSDQIRNGTVLLNVDNGEHGGLELQLYAHSDQYVPYFSDGIEITFL